MKGSHTLRLLALAGLVGSLCGCVSTSFEFPPLAAQACDPALVGTWQSLDKSGKADGEMRLQISPECKLDATDVSAGKERHGEATVLSTARRGGQSYAWINAGWASRRFEFKELPADSQDAFLFRYRVQGGQLQVESIDHVYLAHKIIDGQVAGSVHKDENDLINRVTGPARPEFLDLQGLFAADDIVRFQRESATP